MDKVNELFETLKEIITRNNGDVLTQEQIDIIVKELTSRLTGDLLIDKLAKQFELEQAKQAKSMSPKQIEQILSILKNLK